MIQSKLSEKQKKYRKFFKQKLKEYNVTTPADLNKDEKIEFFNEIEKEWKEDVPAAAKLIHIAELLKLKGYPEVSKVLEKEWV